METEQSAAPIEEKRHRSKGTIIAAVAVVAFAFVIRAVGLASPLPYIYHPDEPINFEHIRKMVLAKTGNPHAFHYPSLFFDVQAFVHEGYVRVGTLLGWFAGAKGVPSPYVQTEGNSIMHNASALVTARGVTVVFGIGVVIAAMWMAWLITRDRLTMVLAGGLVAIQPILVRNSRWVTPDMLAALTVTLTIALAVRLARTGRTRDSVLCAVAAGLAVSSKYNVVLVLIPLVLAHVFARREHEFSIARRLVLCAAIVVGAFLVTTPYSVLDFHSFWHDATFEVHHYQTGHPGAQGNSLTANVAWLWNSTGPLLLLALGIWSLKGRTRTLMLLPATFVAPYFVLLSAEEVRFERNLVPLLPALCVIVAGVVVHLGRALWQRGSPVLRAVAIVLGVLLVLWPLAFALRDTRDATTDPRAAARNWLTANVPPGSRVLLEDYSPYVDPTRYKATTLHDVVVDTQSFDTIDPDVVIINAGGSGRYLGNRTAADALGVLRDRACQDVIFGSGGDRTEILRLTC